MSWKFWASKKPEQTKGGIIPSSNAQDTSEQTIYSDEIAGYGPRAATQRSVNNYKAIAEGDMRRVISNTNDLQGLDIRFAKEFDKAVLHLERRKSEENTLPNKVKAMVYEDLGADKRYQHWQTEQDALEQRIGLHWVDKSIDRASTTFMWALRLWTTVGILVGTGRTAHLWRTIDKRYAKLNGVSLGSIATFEICLNAMKGAGAAFVGTIGVAIGDALPHLFLAIYYRDPVYRSREWYHIMTAASMFGFMSSSVFALSNLRLLGRSRAMFLTVGCTAIFTEVGYYVGRHIYQPFVDKQEHRYDDPYWRPWYLRNMQREGNARHQKGRLL